ncbi:MAG: DUF1566 domain-containing protein [Paludibacteraceae bacterium]|nr:DUF1566 domain-containing protein [Paludibacteraceae bacterium]
MKKLILSSLAMASLAFAANAVTNMCVEQSDGTIVRYDVNKVKQVYYATADQGVTVSGKEGIYTYVDLGLESGTKWATCNVGATKPTEYGDYFAWGETKPKEEYRESTYKWCKGSSTSMTKYCTDSYFGTVDNKKVLDAEDDAATANWGSAWRMPTRDEIKELLDGCSWEWVNDFNGSGVRGRLGTSKKNGATIFLPAAGYRIGTDFYSVGKYGYYWSSSLEEDISSHAYCLYFLDGDIDWVTDDRYYGHCVRAVLR